MLDDRMRILCFAKSRLYLLLSEWAFRGSELVLVCAGRIFDLKVKNIEVLGFQVALIDNCLKKIMKTGMTKLPKTESFDGKLALLQRW